MSDSFEVEIKVLLGSKEQAEKLITQIRQRHTTLRLLGHTAQLNHYFAKGTPENFIINLKPYTSADFLRKARLLFEKSQSFSVRTRQEDGLVFLFIKAVVDDTNSENGIARQELEIPVKITLEELDQILINSDFVVQAKWSRERDTYIYNDVTVCIDKNAGYGYLAEFEKVITDPSLIGETKQQLLSELESFGLIELSQERLSRMFAHYNTHWTEYYKTDKTFVVE